MSYRVDNRAEVRERLKEYGSPTAEDIRGAHGAKQHHDIHAPGPAAPVRLDADASPGVFDADLSLLRSARAALAAEHARLPELIARAAGLQSEIKDGHGPISQAMSHAFQARADSERGVSKALAEYQAELAGLLGAMDRTIAGYQQAEESAVGDLGQEESDVV